MRVFLMLLIFSLAVGTFSGGARAYGKDTCDPGTAGKTVDDVSDESDCPKHQIYHNKKADNPEDASSKIKCTECVHCHASQVIGLLPDFPMGLPPQADVLKPTPLSLSTGDYFFSLLRPPKSFV